MKERKDTTDHIINVTSRNISWTTDADRKYRDALRSLNALTPEQVMANDGVYQAAIDKVEDAYKEANQKPE